MGILSIQRTAPMVNLRVTHQVPRAGGGGQAFIDEDNLPIIKALPPEGLAAGEQAPAGGGTQEATYLSAESLTFPGLTGFATILMGVIARVQDEAVKDWEVVVIGIVLGGMLIALGLYDPERVKKNQFGVVVQVIVGVCNTVLLIAAMFGIVAIASD